MLVGLAHPNASTHTFAIVMAVCHSDYRARPLVAGEIWAVDTVWEHPPPCCRDEPPELAACVATVWPWQSVR